MILIKRIISVLLMLAGTAMDWIEFELWSTNTDKPAWAVGVSNMFSSSKGSLGIECSSGGDTLTGFMGFFCALGTIFCALKIINVIGETMVDYQKPNSPEGSDNPDEENAEAGEESSEAGDSNVRKALKRFLRGYQIIHGWNETVLEIVFEDIPQLILLVIFHHSCILQFDGSKLVMSAIWYFIKTARSNFRMSSCKHVYRPCCNDCCDCCHDCCTYKCNFVCACHVCICRLCPKPHEKAAECVPYNICPDFLCKRDGVLFGPIKEDPNYAKDLYRKATSVFFLIFFISLIWQIANNITIVLALLSFFK